MRVLIDTEICDTDGDSSSVSFGKLLDLLEGNGVAIVIHPHSSSEIPSSHGAYSGEIAARIASYKMISSPPNPDEDYPFRTIIKWTGRKQELREDRLIYSVYKNAVDFLITDSSRIHKKAVRVQVSDRVLHVDEAIKHFDKQFSENMVLSSAAVLRRVPLRQLDVGDPIFDELKAGIIDFDKWFSDSAYSGNEAWVYFEEMRIRAIMMLSCDAAVSQGVPAKRVLHVPLFKVLPTGYSLGELFIRMAVENAAQGGMDRITLRYRVGERDQTVQLLEDLPPDGIRNPVEISRRYYPSFYDGESVKKFIVPIQPRYHHLLFQDATGRRENLFDDYIFVAEGSAIKKAYVGNANIRRIQPGDILLFYLIRTEKSLTTLGVVEEVYYDVDTPDKILRRVGKRTVYKRRDVEQFAERGALIALFRWHFYLQNFLRYDDMVKWDILSRAPQTVMEVSHERYLRIKKSGGIPAGYTVS